MKRWMKVSLVVAVTLMFIALTPQVRASGGRPKPVEVVNVPVPFQATFEFSFSTEGFDTDQVSVPADMMLVIEQITVHAGVPTGSRIRVRVGTTAGGSFAYHVVGLPPTQALDSQFDTVNASIPVKLYANPGTNVSFLFDALRSLPAGFGASGEGTISGHLVDCAPGSGCP